MAAEVYDGFEDPATMKWVLADHDCTGLRVLQHRHSRRISHTGGGAESIEHDVGYGTRLNFRYAIKPIWLNYDIDISVWLKSTSPGAQLKAEVVLPNTLDAARKRPLRIPIHGEVYDQPGQWQRLSVENSLQTFQKKLPVFRSQYGSKFDLRGAYISHLVLNLYSGRGRTITWIDDLAIQGGITVDETRHVFEGPIFPQDAAQSGSLLSGEVALPQIVGNQLVGEFQAATIGPDGRATGPKATDRRPMFLRIARHRGESFRWLKSVGFNAILVDGLVTAEMNTEAKSLGIWLIAPPPQFWGKTIDRDSTSRVAVWWLGDELRERDLVRIQELSDRVRNDDPLRRPIGISPSDSVWRFSRIADIIMFRFPGLGGDEELSELSEWVTRRQAQNFRRGVTFVELPTDFPSELTDQLQQLGMEDAAEAPLAPEQLRVMVFRAVATGIRGLCLQANSRLDQTTSATTARAAVIELIQSDLEIIEPWLAGGRVSERLRRSPKGHDIQSLRTDRSTLLFVFSRRSQQQHVIGGLGEMPQQVVIPPYGGTPMVHEITSYGLNRLRMDRIAGARSITLPAESHVALIALTDDLSAMQHLARTTNAGRQRRTELAFEIAARTAQHVELIHREISRWASPDQQIEQWLSDVRGNIIQAKALLESGDFRDTSVYVRRALNRLSQIRERDWRGTSGPFPRPQSTAAAAGFMTIPAHQMFRQTVSQGNWGRNVLPAGNMESLERLLEAGWQQHVIERGTVHGVASLEPDSPHGGQSSLQLTLYHDGAAMMVREQPSVRIQTAPIRVRAGQIIQYRCTAQLLESADSATRLVVRDSIGGVAQQWSFRETSPDWKDVLAYRVASEDTEFQIDLSLHGLGRARIDDLEIRILQR
jgi:hypothetical protein